MVCLANHNFFSITIPKGSKIAQMLIMPCWRGQVGQISELSETRRIGRIQHRELNMLCLVKEMKRL